MAQKKIYVITKNAQYCKDLHFDTVEGFSLAKESVKELKSKRPEFDWNYEVYNPSKHF